MYIGRALDAALVQWAAKPRRKPLVLRGARQTGKTSAVRRLGERFALYIELNLERFEDISLVRGCNSSDELLVALRSRFNVARFADPTLLFIDEIQESPEAIQWLRFFYEDHPELRLVAAGSLMEVRLQDRGFSFPVGRVTFHALRPLSFFEFLHANDKDVLATTLTNCVRQDEAISAALQDQARHWLSVYLQVGGMPEATKTWLQTQSVARCREIHNDLIQALAEDLQRYRGVRDTQYLEAAFASLPLHYGQRYKYESFAPGYRSSLMKSALSKLESAHLITQAQPTSSLSAPLTPRTRSARKLLPLDTAMALTAMGFHFGTPSRSPIDTALGGRVAEMFVGQELICNLGLNDKLFFWVSESARANAELDFLLPTANSLVPIEVKRSASGSLRSLHQFLWHSKAHEGVRLHDGPAHRRQLTVKMPDGHFDYTLRSLPLWAASLLADESAGETGQMKGLR